MLERILPRSSRRLLTALSLSVFSGTCATPPHEVVTQVDPRIALDHSFKTLYESRPCDFETPEDASRYAQSLRDLYGDPRFSERQNRAIELALRKRILRDSYNHYSRCRDQNADPSPGRPRQEHFNRADIDNFD